MNSRPDSALTESPTALMPRTSLSKTPRTSPPERRRIFFNGIEEKKNLSPGLVVMGGHSCYEGRGFESCCCILDGHNIFDMYLL